MTSTNLPAGGPIVDAAASSVSTVSRMNSAKAGTRSALLGNDSHSLSSAAQLIGESLKTPDDLHKITTLRKKIRGELASVESKLRAGAKDQLDATRDGIARLIDTRVTVGEIREQMVNVHRLCDDDRTHVQGFDKIGEVCLRRLAFLP